EPPVALDALSRGHRAAVDPDVPFYVGKTGDRALVARIAREHPLTACVHFAACGYARVAGGAPLGGLARCGGPRGGVLLQLRDLRGAPGVAHPRDALPVAHQSLWL